MGRGCRIDKVLVDRDQKRALAPMGTVDESHDVISYFI